MVEINKTDAGTRVVEHYRIPLPAWLSGWIQRALVRSLDRVWEEDLAVKLPRGGGPGVPGVDHRNLPEQRRVMRRCASCCVRMNITGSYGCGTALLILSH